MKAGKRLIGTLLTAAWVIPYHYLAMYCDAVFGSSLLYAVVIAAIVMLCIVAFRTGNAASMFIGNILSAASSAAMAGLFGFNDRDWYFKPFSAFGLIVTVAILILIIQSVAYMIRRKKKLP